MGSLCCLNAEQALLAETTAKIAVAAKTEIDKNCFCCLIFSWLDVENADINDSFGYKIVSVESIS